MINNTGAPDATCKVGVGRAEAQVAPTTAGQPVKANLLPNATFSFYLAPATQVRYYKEATVVDVYRCLTDPKVAKRQTETLRSLTDKEQRAAFKRTNFHYCTFSGTFGTERKNDKMQRHSSLICFDFDHLDDLAAVKSLLLADPQFETLLLFTSPSGNGLKWVISIDLSRASHEQWFQAVANYLMQTYQLQADPACRNVARACFIPYDPEAYIAPRLLPELRPIVAENPAVLGLMSSLSATQISVQTNGK